MTHNKKITYMYSCALFTCDCGKEVLAHTLNWKPPYLYMGKCKDCGLNWEIKNKMIRSTPTVTNVPNVAQI